MRIIITVSGGVVQAIQADGECQVAICDLDTEGAPEETICPPMDKRYKAACVRTENFDSDYGPYDNDPVYAEEFDNLWDHFQKFLNEEED